VGFRFAASTSVFDFFAVLLIYRRNDFIFKVDKFSLRLQCIMGACHYAFSAAIATVRVNYYVEFA
jgi:hypothetical protein